MKFKSLISKIKNLQENAPEATFGGGLFIGTGEKVPTSALSNKGTFNIRLPRSLDAINAMLLGFSSKDYIDPDEVLSILKTKLNHFGFDFEYSTKLMDGDNVFPLVQYGSSQLGVYGQNPYDDVNKKGFNQGDGIKEKLGHGLNLLVSVQRSPNMLRRVNMMIVPGMGDSGESDAENSSCGCGES